MGSGLVRIAFLCAALCGGVVAAAAADCPGNPYALGTSRTIVVDPREHGRIGTMDYAETLPLVDHEVVLTFDDGPIPPYTAKILDILAAECVKATYFIVGEMAREYPALVRRAYAEGHTIGTHSMTHPNPFQTQGIERIKAQIDNGIAATGAALGGVEKVAPFFRFPGFGHTAPAEEYTAARGLMVWGADVPADDWHKIGPSMVANLAIRRLEAKGKGILLLHDIHQRTVDALPAILAELKARGFRIVHVVPSSAERPATITTAEQWNPSARPGLIAPITVASLHDLDNISLVKKSETELCSLTGPVHRHAARMANHKRMRPARLAHAGSMADPTLDRHAVQ